MGFVQTWTVEFFRYAVTFFFLLRAICQCSVLSCYNQMLTANCPSVGAFCSLIVGCLRAYDTVCGVVSAQFYFPDKAELVTVYL